MFRDENRIEYFHNILTVMKHISELVLHKLKSIKIPNYLAKRNILSGFNLAESSRYITTASNGNKNSEKRSSKKTRPIRESDDPI